MVPLTTYDNTIPLGGNKLKVLVPTDERRNASVIFTPAIFYCHKLIMTATGTITHSRPESGWRGAVFPGLTRAVPHHFTVDRTADTVVQLHIEFGQNIRCRVKEAQIRRIDWDQTEKKV